MKKLALLLSALSLFSLCSCNEKASSEIFPTELIVARDEFVIAVDDERDLNDWDPVTVKPDNATNKNVVWSGESAYFSLNGSIMKGLSEGRGSVRVTSVANPNLYKDISVIVALPVMTYSVSLNQAEGFTVNGLLDSYQVGDLVEFSIQVTAQDKTIDYVKANGEDVDFNGTIYSFTMPGENVVIDVKLKDLEEIKATEAHIIPSSLKLTVGGKDGTLLCYASPNNTTDEPVWSLPSGEDVVSISFVDNKATVKALKAGNAIIKVTYNENVFASCSIVVEGGEPTPEKKEASVSTYEIKYDLGTRKTAKLIENAADVLAAFSYKSGEENFIGEVSQNDYVYGGGNGGRNDTAWVSSDLLKLGTTSVSGSFTISLSKPVNRIKLTGYVYDTSCKIKAGDSASSDWESEDSDFKTTTLSCSNMNLANKSNVEAKNMSTLTLDFSSCSSLRIATANAKPFYLSSIEFLTAENA